MSTSDLRAGQSRKNGGHGSALAAFFFNDVSPDDPKCVLARII
jgi:hypothetical protein